MRYPICRCNNCSGVFIDNNPGDVVVMATIPFEGAYPELEQIKEKDTDEIFTGCPVCQTDGYLSDIQDLAELWICTDASTGQFSRQIWKDKIYEFRELCVHGVQGGDTWEKKAMLNIEDYTTDEICYYCEPFGYSMNVVKQWLDNKENIARILECIFEMTEN